MIKPFIIFFNTVSVFLFSFFFGDTPVSISGNFPKNVKAESEFTAEIKINKSNVVGFAKLQLEVPQGFTVNELDSKTGNFSFTNNIAKIIWTSMPSDSDFVVKFTISTDASVSGTKTITSKFSFVNNNNKEVVEMTPVEIMVGNETAQSVVAENQPAVESVTETTVPALTTNSSIVTPSYENNTEPSSTILCSRIISSGTIANEVNVEVKIKKGNIKGFAKFQEVLPVGFNAKVGKTNGSSFSVSDGKLKFVWVSLPGEEELVVSYILEKVDVRVTEAKLDNGEFSYLENDQSKKIKLQVGDIGNILQSEIVETETFVKTQTVVKESTTLVATADTTSVEPVKTEQVNEVKKELVAKKEGNVVYNVQIGAYRNAIKSNILSNMYNISETIKSEMADGFNKFMVGNFIEYKDARSHRETIKQKGCRDAFVVAYNGAKRITVQEALMITSQKWFK